MSKLTTLPARFLNSWVKLCTGREMQEALDEEHYRQQILVITSLFWLLTVLAVTVAIRVFIDLSPEGVVAATALLLSTSLSVLACILILRLMGNRILALHMLLFVYTAAFTVACVHFGGTRSPTYALLILTPVLAGIAGSVWASMFWGTLVMLIWITLLVLERLGVQFQQIIQPQNYNLAIAISYIAMGTAVSSINMVYAEMNKALRTTLKSTNRELDYLSSHDDLTGLRNRRFYDERMARSLERARELSGGLALFMFDLNDFKAINDTHGHGVGDMVLASLGERLQASIRGADLIARLGGDEFAVIVEDLSDPESARHIAHKLLEAVEQPISVRWAMLSVGASCGVALFPTHGTSQTELEEAADRAMYRAKHEGLGVAIAGD